ncbi:hypothetical protein [Helicobacter acinonychis]|uniref:hypothetical protein n=1 Tax=Helicobacter acinonychis TaxID=212 RepID=UPI000CF141CB|nr:hypothetical protein [Helicobacter acinonychis]
MIKSFAEKETELVFNEIFSQKLPPQIQPKALPKLLIINNANDLNGLCKQSNFKVNSVEMKLKKVKIAQSN